MSMLPMNGGYGGGGPLMGRSYAQYGNPALRQLAYADALLRNASSTEPVRTPLEGVARALQGGVGGYFANKAQEKLDAREQAKQQAIANALSAGMGQTNLPGPNQDGSAGYSTGPDRNAMMQALAQNPDTAPLALNMLGVGMKPEAFGAPIKAVGPDGKPVYVQPGSAGTMRPVEGFAPPPQQINPTAPMQNFQYRQELAQKYGENSPQVQQYDSMVRAPQYQNLGGSIAVLNPVTPTAGPVQNIPKTLPPEQTPEVKGQQAAATASGEIAGKTVSQAKVDLPKMEQQGKIMIDLLDKLENHPGLEGVVGVPSIAGALHIPGTKEADFRARLDQIKGQQFLQAYQNLKGGGQITEVEGTKAENAIARMNTAQTEKEFKSAIDEFRSVINGSLERTRQQAGGGGTTPTSPAQPPALPPLPPGFHPVP